ncbi:MAG TPA: hypothetical protein VFI42_04800 [Thermomicrobiaceae bacterium]|nr:hypothetical protein [Thermomicrobiaceae bacterium]
MSANGRPLMYVGLHGTDDPTKATLPFVAAHGAAGAGIDSCVVLVDEGAALLKPGMIEAVYGVGFPALAELVGQVREAGIPLYV